MQRVPGRGAMAGRGGGAMAGRGLHSQGRGYGEDERNFNRGNREGGGRLSETENGRGYNQRLGRGRGWPRYGQRAWRGGNGHFGHREGFSQDSGRASSQEMTTRNGPHSGKAERNKKQEEEDAQGKDGVMAEAVGDEDGEGEGTDADVKCSRCARKGHAAAKCTTELYCVICNGHADHINHRCPILKMPRPVANAVGYAVHGLGFYHIPRPPLPRARKETRMALISVEGGELTKEQVRVQMQRLFPGRWNWELSEHETNAFITEFPSRAELQRSIAFGGADVKEAGVLQGVRLKFELWHEKEEGFLLPKVWIRVFGIRKSLREFMELWAVGSMLGSTQTVDMETTRKSDFGRVFVAVLNPMLIPSHLDVVIGDHYFELVFEVEKLGVDEHGEEMEVEWSRDAGGEEDEKEDHLQDEDYSRECKRMRGGGCYHGGDENGNKEQNTSGEPSQSSLKNLVQNMSEEEFTIFLREKAEAILDLSVNEVLDEVVDKVPAEEETDYAVPYVTKEGERDDVAMEVDGKEVANTVNNMKTVVVGRLQGDNQTDSIQADRIPKAAMIPEAIISPTRSSPRLTGSSDEHTMEKAQRRASAKALENNEGKGFTSKGKSAEAEKDLPSKDELQNTIVGILKKVDINKKTFSDILELLDEHYKMDLSSRKEAIKSMICDELVMLAAADED